MGKRSYRVTWLAVVVLSAWSATAAEKGDKADKKEATSGNSQAQMKPPPELQQLNGFVGSWKCTGKMHMPPEMGGEQTMSSTMTIKKDMNGYWFVGQWKSEKTKTMPEMKGTMMWGYNVVDKKFVEMGVDSGGGMMHGTSQGPEGNKWVWNEDGVMMGKKMTTRTTVTLTNPSELEVRGEVEAEPGKWMPMEEDSCKKAKGVT